MNVLQLPVVEQYLQSVSNALVAAPADRRNEVLEQLADHVVAAMSEEPADGDAIDPDERARGVVERLGSPVDIALAAGVAPYGLPTDLLAVPREPTYTVEHIAIIAFVISLAVPLLAWIVGFILMWMSTVWSFRQKLVCTVATLPLVLGPTIPMALLMFSGRSRASTTSGPAEVLVPLLVFLVLVAAPIAALIWLGRSVSAHRRRGDRPELSTT